MATPQVTTARTALKAAIRGLESATNRPLEMLTVAQVEEAMKRCQRCLIEANNALAGRGIVINNKKEIGNVG